MRKLFLIFAVLVLSGCVSIPATREALREEAYDVHEGCSQLPLKTVYEIVSSNAVRCHGGPVEVGMMVGAAFVSVAPENVVHSQISDDSSYAEVSVEHVNPVLGGFLHLIEIEETTTCSSFISVYLLNKNWRNEAESVFLWLEGDTESC